MLTLDDIVSRCPLSKRPMYLVFSQQIPRQGSRDPEPYWVAVASVRDPSDAIFWANSAVDDKGYVPERFVVEMTQDEAASITTNHLTFTDAQVAIYRTPGLSVAAE